MTKPTPRAELVKAIGDAWSIVDEAIPLSHEDGPLSREEFLSLRAAAMPVILRELLDYEVQ